MGAEPEDPVWGNLDILLLDHGQSRFCYQRQVRKGALGTHAWDQVYGTRGVYRRNCAADGALSEAKYKLLTGVWLMGSVAAC